MHDIPEEAVKAAYGAYVTFIEEGGSVPVIDAVRAAITAALPFIPGQGAVKKLEWGNARITDDGREAENAESPVGRYIATDTGWFLLGQTGYEVERGLYQSKAAAQQDFEARILSALEPSAAPVQVFGNSEQLGTKGRYEARYCKDIPTDCCEYGVIDHSAGKEVCRVWKEEDAGRIAELLNGVLQPFAARELALEEGDLNARLKAKGMYSIDEMMGSLPLDKWRVHSGMTDLKFFGEWLERKTRDYCTMHAAYEVGDKDVSDELYEWVLAHYSAFHDVLVNFRAAIRALSSPDHADAGKVEGDGWRPIESAPKDGTPVLAYQAGRYFKCWLECDQYEGGYFWQDEEDSEPSPTHWRPLPSAPASEGAE